MVGAMHCYLFVTCKTLGCGNVHILKHVEWPTDDYAFVDVPKECFPFSLKCGCGQTHSYEVKEVQTDTSLTPLHPSDFRSVLPDLPANSSDTN